MIFGRFSIFAVIPVIFLIATANTANAANRSLFMLGNVRQWLDLSYTLNQSKTKTSSLSQNYFTERYNVGTEYALINPRILNGTLAASIEANQFNTSSRNTVGRDGEDYAFQYDIKAVILDKSPIPLNLMLQSQIQEVQRSYGGDYRLYYDIFGATWSLRNRYIPVSFNFVRSVSSTDGLADNRETEYTEFGLHAQNYVGISQTILDLVTNTHKYTNDLSTVADSTSSTELKLTNHLRWNDLGKTRDIRSQLRLKENSGLEESETFSLSESVGWDLGKALTSGLSYNLDRQTTFRGEQQMNSGNIWLQHMLFKSLSTNLMTNARRSDFQNGSETEWGGRIALAYKKTLPRQSVLSLNTYRQYNEIDRSFSDSRFSPPEEEHRVVFGQNIPLRVDYIPNTIRVRNANQGVRADDYVEGTDYRVDTLATPPELILSGAGLSGRITADSLLPDGDRVLVSYEVLSDAEIRFSTDSWGAGGDLSLYNGLFRIFSRYGAYEQDSLSRNTSQRQILGGQSTYTVGGEVRLEKILFSTQYSESDGAFQQSKYVDSLISYNDTWGKGTISLYLKNNYRWSEPVDGVERDSQDLFGMGGSYRRPAFLLGRFMLTSNYDRYMASTTTDRLSVTAQFDWTFRKFVLALQSRFGYTRLEGSTTHSEHVRVHLIRYF